MGLGVSLFQEDEMMVNSLSNINQDISQIIKIFENNLVNINEELVFLTVKFCQKKIL